MTGCATGNVIPPKPAAKMVLPSVSVNAVPVADAANAVAAFELGGSVDPAPTATATVTSWALNGTHFGIGYVTQNTNPPSGGLVVMSVDSKSQQWGANFFAAAFDPPTGNDAPFKWLPSGTYGAVTSSMPRNYQASLWFTKTKAYAVVTVPSSYVNSVTGTPIHAGKWSGTLVTTGGSQSLLVPLSDGKTSIFATLGHKMPTPMQTQALEGIASSSGAVVTVKQSSSLPK